MAMTKRDQYSFVLYSFLPELEERGMTIKTRNAGELTLSANDPDVAAFIQSFRNRLIAVLNRPSAPPSPYGNGL